MNHFKPKATDACTPFSPWIEVYVDGELDPTHAALLEAHAITCSTCAERVAMLQAMRRSVRRTSARRCPGALRARIGGRIGGEGQSPRFIRLRYAVGLAAAAGVVFAMGTSRHVLGDGAPLGRRLMTGFDVLDELVSLHENPLPPETTNPDELVRWDRLVGVPVRRPPFQPLGASFEGARVHSMSDRRAALFLYTLRGHRVTVYVFNPRVVEVRSMPLEEHVVHQRPVYVGRLRGYSIAAAEQSGIGYALASDLGPEQSTDLVLAALPH